jgi:hypothetical protein
MRTCVRAKVARPRRHERARRPVGSNEIVRSALNAATSALDGHREMSCSTGLIAACARSGDTARAAETRPAARTTRAETLPIRLRRHLRRPPRKCRRSHALTIGCTSVSHLRRVCSSSSKPSDRDSCNSRNRRCKRRRFNPTWFRTEPARRTSNAVSGVVARSPRTEGAPAEEFAFKVATRPRPSGARKRRRRRRPPRTPLFLTCTVSGLLVAYSSQRIQRFMSLLPNHHGSTLPRRRQR